MILKALVALARMAWTWLVAGPTATTVWLVAELMQRSPRYRPA